MENWSWTWKQLVRGGGADAECGFRQKLIILRSGPECITVSDYTTTTVLNVHVDIRN